MSANSHKRKLVRPEDTELWSITTLRAYRCSSASIANLIIEEQGPSILIDGAMLEGYAAVAWAHNIGLDSAYTLNIEHYVGAGGHCLRHEIIIEVNSHAGRRQIHNLAHVIPAPHYRAAERGDGMA